MNSADKSASIRGGVQGDMNSLEVADVADGAIAARVVNDQMANLGMTQRKLAEQSGVSATTLRKIQSGGEQRRTRATLASISLALAPR